MPGYFNLDEAWALNRAVLESSAADPLRVVEIGSYKGRSTIAICLALNERRSGLCVSVDPHAPTGKESYTREHGTEDTHGEYLANVEPACVTRFTRAVKETSASAAQCYDGVPIDVLFIDGSHDYDDVCLDVALWTPLLRQQAIIAFNDPYAPGVNRAIREFARARSRLGGFKAAYHVNNTLFLSIGTSVTPGPTTQALPRIFLLSASDLSCLNWR